MKKIQYLYIRFENRLSMEELMILIELIAGKMQEKSKFFVSDSDRYPLIQYKLFRNRLCMVCLGEGANEVTYLLQSKELHFVINHKNITLSVEDFKVNYFILQSWNTLFDYKIDHWIPFSTIEEYIAFTQIDNNEKRIGLLQKRMRENLTSFYNELDCEVDDNLKIDLTFPFKISFSEENNLTDFSFYFTSNLSIPQYGGLGVNAVLGNGVVNRINNKLNI
jgi:hypothetical protein